jgi:hypothetical protein
MDPDEKAAIEAARAKLAWGQSDHLAIVRAFNLWRDAGGWNARRDFADEHGLSHETLRNMSDLRAEFAGVLSDMGFLPGRQGRVATRGGGGAGGSRAGTGAGADEEPEYEGEGEEERSSGQRGRGGGGGGGGKHARGGAGGGGGGGEGGGPSATSYGRYGELSGGMNACSDQVNVIRAALVAGLYPNVIKVVTPERRYHETIQGALPVRCGHAFSVRPLMLLPLAHSSTTARSLLTSPPRLC